MNPTNPVSKEATLADQLQQESRRLAQLAERARAEADELAEMKENYPYFKKFVYAKLIEEAKQRSDEIPDDVEAAALEQGGVMLASVLQEFEELAQGERP